MKPKSFANMVCSIAGALEILGDRWTMLVLRDLMLGLSRYDELSRSTEIPPTTLANRLRLLEEEGLVVRTPYQFNPPRFDYFLTAAGRNVGPVFLALAEWGDKHGSRSSHGAPLEFFSLISGHPVRQATLDIFTGAQVAPADVGVREGPGADETVRWRLEQRLTRAGSRSDNPPASEIQKHQ